MGHNSCIKTIDIDLFLREHGVNKFNEENTKFEISKLHIRDFVLVLKISQ